MDHEPPYLVKYKEEILECLNHNCTRIDSLLKNFGSDQTYMLKPSNASSGVYRQISRRCANLSFSFEFNYLVHAIFVREGPDPQN